MPVPLLSNILNFLSTKPNCTECLEPVNRLDRAVIEIDKSDNTGIETFVYHESCLEAIIKDRILSKKNLLKDGVKPKNK